MSTTTCEISALGPAAMRYTPGIQVHQGENNRDQVIIRGNSSSADFFVDGVRDDVQYYRDLYNVDRVEALKGPNATMSPFLTSSGCPIQETIPNPSLSVSAWLPKLYERRRAGYWPGRGRRTSGKVRRE